MEPPPSCLIATSKETRVLSELFSNTSARVLPSSDLVTFPPAREDFISLAILKILSISLRDKSATVMRCFGCIFNRAFLPARPLRRTVYRMLHSEGGKGAKKKKKKEVGRLNAPRCCCFA